MACEHVFNLHARPAKKKREVEVTSCRRLCPLKCSICDGYQMQISEHRKPSFTKDFPATLSCIQTEAGFKGTPETLKQKTFKTDGKTVKYFSFMLIWLQIKA